MPTTLEMKLSTTDLLPVVFEGSDHIACEADTDVVQHLFISLVGLPSALSADTYLLRLPALTRPIATPSYTVSESQDRLTPHSLFGDLDGFAVKLFLMSAPGPFFINPKYPFIPYIVNL